LLYRLARGFDRSCTNNISADLALKSSAHGGHNITRAPFEQNMDLKLNDPQYTADISPLPANGYSWDITKSADAVMIEVSGQILPGVTADTAVGGQWRTRH
jgi:hypothetical protein